MHSQHHLFYMTVEGIGVVIRQVKADAWQDAHSFTNLFKMGSYSQASPFN